MCVALVPGSVRLRSMSVALKSDLAAFRPDIVARKLGALALLSYIAALKTRTTVLR